MVVVAHLRSGGTVTLASKYGETVEQVVDCLAVLYAENQAERTGESLLGSGAPRELLVDTETGPVPYYEVVRLA